MRSTTSPTPRASSPAVSEISVGSPSPPPVLSKIGSHSLPHVTAFRPLLHLKRRRLSHERSATSSSQQLIVPPAPVRRKSSAERVKSFSIADILGRKDSEERAVQEATERDSATTSETARVVAAALSPTVTTILPAQLINERLPTMPAHPSPLLLDVPVSLSKAVHHWDPIRGPIPLAPFFPPALLQYEQRLAWDYQRQLQEHFQAQAQLLRQMSLDPTIIPSEDGSERSHSSSTGSDCCSPEVNVHSNDSGGEADNKCASDGAPAGASRKFQSGANTAEYNEKLVGDTPLDALFQLSTKNFDEEQDPGALNIFATRPNPKKKRKSRTAFTNHQIFELEKRFLYQKYLSPADRDEIAAGLGLSNAQVITWFQNRRAKLKRDMEELKKDVESVKQLHDQSADLSHRLQQHQLQILAATHQSQHVMACNIFPTYATRPQPPAGQPLKAGMAAALGPLTSATPTAPTAPTAKEISSHRACSSTSAEDKKELKMLKMMTLMYYSSRRSGEDIISADVSTNAIAIGTATATKQHSTSHSRPNGKLRPN